jgi:hypothetical protein
MLTSMLLTAGQGQISQSAAAEAEPEADDMPPVQNTLDSHPAEADPEPALAAAPAGPASNTPQLPQQSLVDKLNDVAEEEPVMTKAVGTEDGSIAFVTEPGIAEGIQTSADAAAVTAGLEGAISIAGKAGIQSSPGKAGVQTSAGKAAEQGSSAAATQLAKDTEESTAGEQADQSPAKTRASRAAKAAATTVKAANTAVPKSGGRRSSARFVAEKKKHSGASAAGSNSSSGKENGTAVPAEEANHMAEKEPHSRVEEVTGSKGVTPSQVTSGDKKKEEASDKRDPWIGRRIKKDFETDSGLKTYTGWIIGRHEAKKW